MYEGSFEGVTKIRKSQTTLIEDGRTKFLSQLKAI